MILQCIIAKKGDFYNNHNEAFIYLNISQLQCLDEEAKENFTLNGIYTDRSFSYYEFIVRSKYKNNETHFKKIDEYLIENDCKLQFYYTDTIVNSSNYTMPITTFINSLFLQMNPILIQKKNVFFMNYYLINDSKLLHVFDEEENPFVNTGFSRVEDYSIYKGLNRNSQQSSDYDIYAKLYIRVDNKKVEIKRRYQDIMEFYADSSSLLLSIFWFLGFIMGLYDKLKANHSIGKRLFFFEGVENNHFTKFKKLKELTIENQEKEININKLKIENISKSLRHTKTYTRRNLVQNYIRKDSFSVLTASSEKKGDELIKYDSFNLNEMIGKSICSCCQTKKFKSKINLIKQSNNALNDKLDVVLYIRNMILFDLINQIYLENKSIINFLSRPIIYLNPIEEKKEKGKKNEIEIKDFDINTTKEENEEKIEKEEKFEEDFYKPAYKLDSNKLFMKIKKLIQKPEKTKIEQKIISLLEEHLKGV